MRTHQPRRPSHIGRIPRPVSRGLPLEKIPQLLLRATAIASQKKDALVGAVVEAHTEMLPLPVALALIDYADAVAAEAVFISAMARQDAVTLSDGR